MKVTEHLDRAVNPLVSVEIIPPARGGSAQTIYNAIESIRQFKPPFIDVTSHSAEVIYDPMPDGSLKKKFKRKRPGTIGLCAAIKYKFNIDPVPHILCAGFSREETEDALIELNYLGIENLLAIKGDLKYEKPMREGRTANAHATELVMQISQLNKGVYQDVLESPSQTEFCIGVASYPEKHFQSPNLRFDIDVLKQKQDAGADYSVTQMFFENDKYLNYVKAAREAGVSIPIIPGLKILTGQGQMRSIPSAFFVDIPEELTDRMMKASNREKQIEEGIDWAVKQSIGLLESGAKSLHFYIMQNTSPFLKLMDKLKKHL